MRPTRRLLLTLALAAALPPAAAGCGRHEERAPATGSLPQAPPRWHALRAGEVPAMGRGLTIHTPVPIRVAIRYDSPTSATPDPPPRLLPAGAAVTVSWSQEVVPPSDAPTVPPPAGDAEAGRTEGYVVRHAFGFDDLPTNTRATPLWVRPGKGEVLAREAAPPVAGEDLPVGSRIELAAVAIADLAEGRGALVPGAEGTRLRLPAPGAPGDRGQVVRLWLEILPPAP